MKRKTQPEELESQIDSVCVRNKRMRERERWMRDRNGRKITEKVNWYVGRHICLHSKIQRLEICAK